MSETRKHGRFYAKVGVMRNRYRRDAPPAYFVWKATEMQSPESADTHPHTQDDTFKLRGHKTKDNAQKHTTSGVFYERGDNRLFSTVVVITTRVVIVKSTHGSQVLHAQTCGDPTTSSIRMLQRQ